MEYTRNNITIKIDPSKDRLLSEAGIAIMKDRYLLPEETLAQECFARAVTSFASNQDHAQRLYDYVSNLWFTPSTPILSNAGTDVGMPISCFLGDIDDSMEGIMNHHTETAFLACKGGGVGGNWSKLRSAGSKTSRGSASTGVIPFIRMMDTQMMAVSQGTTRRGAYAAYMDVSHPEIQEFVDIRRVTGHDINRRCLGTGFHHAVNITDSFMKAVEEGSEWNLIDPHTKDVKKTVDARSLWMKLLTTRLETGEPYLHFIDTANAGLPSFLKDKGLRINNSNLCIEIELPTSPDRTAVCCLSSVNLEFYDDWKSNPAFIKDVMEFLDNVLSFFIDKAPTQFWRAVNSAKSERSVGLGTMGFHLHLQKNGIPFESALAASRNRVIYKDLESKTLAASRDLAIERGEAPDAAGTGLRFSHRMAIAPNASTAILCSNTSPSIEPYSANAFTQKTMSGNFLIKNKALDNLLQTEYGLKGAELEEIWTSITVNNGSVQHLSFMSDWHKDVFKTALELDQMWIIEHASVRQEFIDQGQSVNIFLRPDIHKTDLHRIHKAAWAKGLKGLYYCRSSAIAKVQAVTVTKQQEDTGCLSCEG